MKGIVFVSSALLSFGFGLTPAIAQQSEIAQDSQMEMEVVMEGDVMRVTETSIFPEYELIVVSGPDEKYYTFYTKDADLKVGDEVYFSENMLYMDDDDRTAIAQSYMMTREAYYDSLAVVETEVEERRVEMEMEMEEDVVVDRPVQVQERRTTVYEAPTTRVETRPAAPVRGLW